MLERDRKRCSVVLARLGGGVRNVSTLIVRKRKHELSKGARHIALTSRIVILSLPRALYSLSLQPHLRQVIASRGSGTCLHILVHGATRRSPALDSCVWALRREGGPLR